MCRVVALLGRARQQSARRQRAVANWCVSLGVFGGCAVGSACGQRSANISKCSISVELRTCRAPPPVLEAMPSLVDRALLKLLGRWLSLRPPRWLVAELRLVLGQMTEEMLQTFVDREEALETSGRVEFDDFGAAGPQTSPAIARSLRAAARSSEAGLRNVADASCVCADRRGPPSHHDALR